MSLTKANIEDIFQTFKLNNPNPNTELNYTTQFQLLIAVLLSAQAQDKTVNRVTEKLFLWVKEPKDLIAYDLEKLKKDIQQIGLYQQKAKNILKTAEILVNRFNGKIPKNRDELESLPGIGTKSAAVLLNALFNQATIAVDTHVSRVSNRLGLVNEADPKKIEEKLLKVVPDWAKKNAHHWLVLHGRYVCQARKPICSKCLISNHCKYYSQQASSL